MVSVITPNESETKLLTDIKVEDEKSAKQAAAVLRKNGVTNVVLTMGSKGSFIVTEDQAEKIPTKEVQAVDTTAAGDAFNGALAFALANGDPLMEAVQFANFVGAFSATKMGAQPSLPFIKELKHFIEK